MAISDPSQLSPYDIRGLSYAEHFCIWAVRTCVACSPQCRTLMREFHHAFGARHGEGVDAYHALMVSLGKGERKVRIGRPGHIDMTADEVCLVSMLAAAQAGEVERFRAHARWIMGHDLLDGLYDDAIRLTGLLAARGHGFRHGEATAVPAGTTGPRVRLAVVGHAVH